MLKNDGTGANPGRGAVGAPFPGVHLYTAFDPYRIEHYVTAELQQVRVLFHQNRLEPSLEQMANPLVAAIEALGKYPV
jgi:hypothetical protein